MEGNFHRDIRGAKVRLRGEGESADSQQAQKYMQGFAVQQKGSVGDMTAGREPADYVRYGYFEWFGEANGRCVIELEPDQVEVLTAPIPACESDPIDRKRQDENMAAYLSGMAQALGIPQENAVSTGHTLAVEKAKKVLANDRLRGMKLLPREIRESLPGLYDQDGKGAKAIAHVKYFTPSSSWTWYVLGGEPELDQNGREADFRFFGLVDGHEKEFGYFMLSELEEVTGPLGLPIERDLWFTPRPLAQIAPELFEGGDS